MDDIQLSVRSDGDHLVVSAASLGNRFRGTGALPEFTAADAAVLRWALEDWPRLSSESARIAGVLAQARLLHFGQRLFDAVREPFLDALAGRLLDAVEVWIEDPQGLARHLPWELMHDDNLPLALACRGFTRATPKTAQARTASRQSRSAGPLRLLIVVARPAGRDDVAFRSIASRVLAATSGRSIQVDLLRPPTFAALRKQLRGAWKSGKPYAIVHFDGHGAQRTTDDGTTRTALAFEPDATNDDGLIDADTMATLLATVNVPLLILNACHAAAETRTAPAAADTTPAQSVAAMSFAEEVAIASGIDVVAMSHAIYVATAALVVEDLYACLEHGHGAAQAVAFARRRWRDAAVERSPDLGFCILRHFGSATARATPSTAAATWPDYGTPNRFGDRTPAHPAMQPAFAAEVALVAADDPLLLLERALYAAPIVQLIGLHGAGKTTLLLELGRWLVASNAVAPERVAYVDLALAANPAAAIDTMAHADGAFLLIDHAERIAGDPLRAVSTWPDAAVDEWRQTLEAATQKGTRIVVAAPAPLDALGDAPRVTVPRLRPADIRTLVELQAGRAIETRIPEAAIRWTSGHPGVAAVLVARARAGAFADPTTTLGTLSDLTLGVLAEGEEALPDLIRPLILNDARALFEFGLAPPWLLMQFQGQMFLTPMLWKLAEAIGMKTVAAAATNGQLDQILTLLERAGLALRLDPENLLLHPLVPFVMPQPMNMATLRTPDHWRMLRLVLALYVRATQTLHGGSPFVNERRPPAVAADWDLTNLLHAFTCATDSGAMEHMAALSFARRLRSSLLAMESAFWPPVFAQLCAAFEKVPPDPDDGLFNPNNELTLLRMEEARRLGDEKLAAELAEKARVAAAKLPGPAEAGWTAKDAPLGWPQANQFDVQIKAGRALAERDPKAARAAFEAALVAAGDDVLRMAYVRLELTRLLRKPGLPGDLDAAREYGEAALATFVSFAKAGLADRSQVAQTAMSLSNVYRDLAQANKPPDAALALRGEALCQASLDNATTPGEHATAWYNLGGWRRAAGDNATAASHFLEAANLYEQLDDPRLLGISLAYRAQCLLESGDPVQARIDGVRATTLLVSLPDKPRDLVLFAYETAERAMAQITGKAGAPPGVQGG